MKSEMFLTESEIGELVGRLAGEIKKFLAGRAPRPVVVCGVLKGCLRFVPDLAAALYKAGLDVEIDFMQCASYVGYASSGSVRCIMAPTCDYAGKTAIIADTVLETGRTLVKAGEVIKEAGAEDILTCVLLDKTARHSPEIAADFVGRKVGDDFLVGYGIDYNQRYRAMPFLARLIKEQ